MIKRLLLFFVIISGSFVGFTHFWVIPQLVDQEFQERLILEKQFLEVLGRSVAKDGLQTGRADYSSLSVVSDREAWIALQIRNAAGDLMFSTGPIAGNDDELLQTFLSHQGKYLGLMDVWLDVRILKEKQKEKFIYYEKWIYAFLLLVLIVVGVFVERSFLRPISLLSGYISRVSKGEFKLDTPKITRGEFGALFVNFHKMAAELEQREQRITQETSEKEEALSKVSQKWDVVAHIVDNSPTPTFTINADHEITHWNKACEKIIGLPREEVLGRSDLWKFFYDEPRPVLADLVMKDDWDQIAHLYENKIKRDEDGTMAAEDYFTKLPNGARWLLFNASKIVDEEGKTVGAIETFLDTTHIHLMREELEAQVKERTKELQSANSKLGNTIFQLERAQKELIEAEKMSSLASLVSGVAHEVNTPLGVCLTASTFQTEKNEGIRDLLSAGKMKKSDLESFIQSCEETSSLLEKNLKRAADLIKSFKQVSVDQSIEDQRIINLNEYVEEVLVSVRPKFKNKPISVNVNIPVDIEYDTYPGVIAQILTNLIMNSLLHAFPDGEGEMEIAAELDDGNLVLLFGDNGVGMDEKTLKNVFEPFYTTKRNKGGTGLGMHIVFNLVSHKLKGAIKCVSSQGQGTQFIITLPLTQNYDI